MYIDLSGWSPKYFPPHLIQYANTLLKKKVLFGSDFPLITPDRWLRTSPSSTSAKRCRYKENAARLLGLGPDLISGRRPEPELPDTFLDGGAPMATALTPHLSEETLPLALEAFPAALGADAVLTDDDELREFRDPFAYRRGTTTRPRRC